MLGYLGLVGIPASFLLLTWSHHLRPERPKEEASPVISLSKLNIALQAYKSTYYKGYPEKLSQLGPPQNDTPLDENSAGFVSAALASGMENGYRFRYEVTARNAAGDPVAFAIHADQADARSSPQPHYYADQTQVIRRSELLPATRLSPPVENDSSRLNRKIAYRFR